MSSQVPFEGSIKVSISHCSFLLLYLVRNIGVRKTVQSKDKNPETPILTFRRFFPLAISAWSLIGFLNLSSSLVAFAYRTFFFRQSDAELCDASLGRGGVQCVAPPQEPREEQEHGRAAS